MAIRLSCAPWDGAAGVALSLGAAEPGARRGWLAQIFGGGRNQGMTEMKSWAVIGQVAGPFYDVTNHYHRYQCTLGMDCRTKPGLMTPPGPLWS